MSVKTLKLELYHSNINITLAAAQQGTVDDLISNQIRLLWTMMMNERTTGQVNTNYKAPLLLSIHSLNIKLIGDLLPALVRYF